MSIKYQVTKIGDCFYIRRVKRFLWFKIKRYYRDYSCSYPWVRFNDSDIQPRTFKSEARALMVINNELNLIVNKEGEVVVWDSSKSISEVEEQRLKITDKMIRAYNEGDKELENIYLQQLLNLEA